MQRLLIVSDSPALSTGLGRVVRELASRAVHHPDLEVSVGGWFHEHMLLRGEGGDFPFPVTPVSRAEPSHAQGLLTQLRPHKILCIGDPEDFVWWAYNKGTAQLVGYLNVDGGPLASRYEWVLDSFDVLATTSEYGAQVIDRPGVGAIHHGVDPTVFFPRRAPTFLERDTSRVFIVLINGQNTFRKNLTVAIQGFSLFSRGKEDHVLLYANTRPNPTHPLDPKPVPNLIDLVFERGITKLVAWNPQNKSPFDTVSDEYINELYNGAAVLLNTALGEGFGLPLLEAMATGCVPIAPDAHSATELLSGGRGFMIPVAARYRTEYGGDGAIVSAEGVAAQLEAAYQEWRSGHLKIRQKAGMQFAMSRPWDRTWAMLLEQMAQRDGVPARPPSAIEPYLRSTVKRAVARITQEDGVEPFGVLKMGGLGDMLQTARVIRAMAAAHPGRRAMVFANGHQAAFLGMPEVAEVMPIRSDRTQEDHARTLAPVFTDFLDVRYVSRWIGHESAYFQRHRWFFEQWAASCARLEGLGAHTTAIMLESLGLPAQNIRPVYDDESGQLPDALRSWNGEYVAAAAGAGTLGKLKLWPAERWAAFSDEMDRHGLRLVQVGGTADPVVPGAHDARGQPLHVTAQILRHARCLVGIEGGMVHLAAAVHTPAVVLFGPTPVRPFAYPWNVNLGRFDCQPCWWSLPTWATETCAIAEPECVNFPDAKSVVNEVQKLKRVAVA